MLLFLAALSWVSMILLIVPLALGLLLALPSGMPLQIAAHAILLVIGAAIVLALRGDDDPT
jgi:hypothetical protein